MHRVLADGNCGRPHRCDERYIQRDQPMTAKPARSSPLPRILDDVWEAPPRNRRRVGLVAVSIGTALVVACVAFLKTSARMSQRDDQRIWGPIATPYEDHVSAAGGGPFASVPTAAVDSVRHAETARPAPRPRAPAAPAPRQPGYLSVNSRPWAELSVDGQVVGNTPQVKVRVIPGRHQLLLARPGFQAHSVWVDVPAGVTVRLTNITLAEITQ